MVSSSMNQVLGMVVIAIWGLTSLFGLSATAVAERAGAQYESDRLKFRDGPVCMCANELTEKDIRNAQQQEKAAPKWDPSHREIPANGSNEGQSPIEPQ